MPIITTDSFAVEPYRRSAAPTPAELGAVVVRQRWVALGTMILVVIIIGLSGLWKPVYMAQMKFLVLRQRADAVITPEVSSPIQWAGDQVSEEDLNSEVELLKSTDLLRLVVVETGLDRDRALAAQSTPAKRIDGAISTLGKRLKVEPIRKSNLISVRYESDSPQLASKVLTALSDAYEAKHIEVHRPSGEFKFFDQQTSQYRQNLAQQQQKILEFNQANRVVAPQLERDLALQRVNEFDASAHQAQSAVQEGVARIAELEKQIASTPQVTSAIRISDNEALLGQLKQTLSTLELRRTEMLGRYTPTYRPLQDLDAQIADLQQSIAKEVSSPLHEETKETNPVYQYLQQELARAQDDVDTMHARANVASATAAQYRAKASNLNQQTYVQDDLVMDAKAQEDNYLLYMHKREEARSSDALDRRGILNVSIAQHPATPSFPVRTRSSALLMTLLMCVTFGVSSAFVADLMVPSFRTPDEATRYLDLPVLACLPKSEQA